jgi:hypothetical protein
MPMPAISPRRGCSFPHRRGLPVIRPPSRFWSNWRAHWGLSEYDAAFDSLAFAQESATHASSRTAMEARIELLVLKGQWHLQLMQLADAERDLQDAARAARAGAPSRVDDVEEARLPLLLLQQRYADARSLAATLLASRRHRLGADHPDTARSLQLQLDVAEQASDAAGLTPAALQTAHSAILSAYGNRHPEYARQLLLEARVNRRHDVRRQLELSRQATQLLEATVGPRHPTTLMAKEEQARALMAVASATPGPGKRTQLREATGLLQEIVHASGQRRWPSPTARYWLAQALLQGAGSEGSTSIEERRQAEALLQDALVEARRHLGADHATTAMIRNALVRDYQQSAGVQPPLDATRSSPR